DRRVLDAARAAGADVPVCLDPRARLMHGIGDVISPPLRFPQLDAVLVYPDSPVKTADVFLAFEPGRSRRKTVYSEAEIPTERMALLRFLANEENDLEPAATTLAPAIGEARKLLETTAPRVVRMSGSGSAVFALYESANAAANAASEIRGRRPDWWVTATTLG
ncbi:MAG: 4-(cytidine 5'-diphospho)-2-C-methyl-D-erythritol kinase, partial [Xanthobacteraceae bacterium]